MSIPGFTADVSLYRSVMVYQAVGSFSLTSSDSQAQGIALAASRRYLNRCWQMCGGDPDCFMCCHCVSHGGHPNECCF